MYLSFYCKGSKRVTQDFTVRGSWRPKRTAIYWPPLLWPSALCLSRSPDAQPEAQGPSSLLDDGFLCCNLSPTGLQNYRGPRGPLRSGVAFPNTSCLWRLWSPTHQGSKSDFLSWLSYITVQRPLNRPLNLWNGMFDRHHAEITVMQFTDHSLPVHQSMSVPLEFYLVPFHQPNPPTWSLSITGHWNVSLLSSASLWNGMFARAEGQNTTLIVKQGGIKYHF